MLRKIRNKLKDRRAGSMIEMALFLPFWFYIFAFSIDATNFVNAKWDSMGRARTLTRYGALHRAPLGEDKHLAQGKAETLSRQMEKVASTGYFSQDGEKGFIRILPTDVFIGWNYGHTTGARACNEVKFIAGGPWGGTQKVCTAYNSIRTFRGSD